MFDEDNDGNFLDEDELLPEDIFQMVTLMPKRKLKITTHLETEDGTVVLLSTIATNLKDYIDKHLGSDESSAVSLQLFPLVNQMMCSAIPRHIGIEPSTFLLTAPTSRYAFSAFGMQIALLMQYIRQKKLKIVTEQTTVTDEQIEAYQSKAKEQEGYLAQAFSKASGEDFD